MSRRTKIVVTLGPSTDDSDTLQEILSLGVDVVRVNFSHGNIDTHRRRIEEVRKYAALLDRYVAVLVDLQGPKIRIARFKEGSAILAAGADFIINTDLSLTAGTSKEVGTDYKNLAKDVEPGDVLLLDDGRLVLKVVSVTGTRITTKVHIGGKLTDHKGINLKGGGLSARALTDKDRKDIGYAAELEADYIAISFPRSGDDIDEARKLLHAAGAKADIIAKIERAEAVSNIDEIVQTADGVMVARGDLAVEIGDAEVPAIQKLIISRADALSKPAITATQMMESMIHSSVPTRAEVSDVANAILDGTDAVMLSAETAVGNNPARVVDAVNRVCLAVEKQPVMRRSCHRLDHSFTRVDEVITMAAMYSANHMKIKAIAAISASGKTPLWMSRIRTGTPIYGLSGQDNTLRKMMLYRNVFPLPLDTAELDSFDFQAEAVDTLRQRGLVNPGDLVILTKGNHPGEHGGTNSLKIVPVI